MPEPVDEILRPIKALWSEILVRREEHKIHEGFQEMAEVWKKIHYDAVQHGDRRLSLAGYVMWSFLQDVHAWSWNTEEDVIANMSSLREQLTPLLTSVVSTLEESDSANLMSALEAVSMSLLRLPLFRG